jgi:hypothetical protein
MIIYPYHIKSIRAGAQFMHMGRIARGILIMGEVRFHGTCCGMLLSAFSKGRIIIAMICPILVVPICYNSDELVLIT